MHISINARSPVGMRLDDLLDSRFALQSAQGRVLRSARLPLRLERCVNRLAPTCVWRAFQGAATMFCAIARTSFEGRQSGGAEPLEVYFLDSDAAVYSAAVWEHDSVRGWWLDSLLDLSYDSENGWWLGPLMEPPVVRVVGSRTFLSPIRKHLSSA